MSRKIGQAFYLVPIIGPGPISGATLNMDVAPKLSKLFTSGLKNQNVMDTIYLTVALIIIYNFSLTNSQLVRPGFLKLRNTIFFGGVFSSPLAVACKFTVN